ncbi:MAG: hypothetical protein ACKPA9_29555 [Microcystis sp.]
MLHRNLILEVFTTIFNFICQEIRSFLGAPSHLNPQLQLICMVRSPKSIAGAVGATLGNAPYKIGDRTEFIFPEMDIYPPDRLYIVILLLYEHS